MAKPFGAIPQLPTQASTPAGNPPAGSHLLYLKADGKLYTKNSAGVESAVSESVAHTHVLTDLPDSWPKRSVKTVTTANHALSGLAAINGYTPVAGDRILVTAQTAPAANGIYDAASGAWARSADANTSAKIAGAVVTIERGTYAGFKSSTTFASDAVLGTTAMNWHGLMTAQHGNAVGGFPVLDASSKVGIAQLPTGQTGTTVALGNDARFTDLYQQAIKRIGNLTIDPYFDQALSSLAGTLYASSNAAVPQANVPAGNVMALPSTYDLFDRPDVGIPCKPGDRFLVDVWICHTGAETNDLQVRLWISSEDVTSSGTAGWGYPGTAVPPTECQNTWVRKQILVDVPATTYAGNGTGLPPKYVFPGFGTGGPTGGNGWWVAQWKVTRVPTLAEMPGYATKSLTASDLSTNLRAQNNLSGGGSVSWLANHVSWSDRFIVISNGDGAHFGTNGYFDINPPPAGTVVPGSGGAANVTVTASGVPLPPWTALYYVLPIGLVQTSLPANFRVVFYTADFVVPDHWVLVALANGDTNGTLKLGDGRYVKEGSLSTQQNPYPQYLTGSVFRQVYTTTVPARVTAVAGAPYVTWVGQVDPAANMLAGDDWIAV